MPAISTTHFKNAPTVSVAIPALKILNPKRDIFLFTTRQTATNPPPIKG
ncbi:MAG: hypothetical protein LBR30_06895 [Clostridioides sp.]|nr:hypothetical protein [Clostridioides sp.]